MKSAAGLVRALGEDHAGPLVAAQALHGSASMPATQAGFRSGMRRMVEELKGATDLIETVRDRLRSDASPELRVEAALALLDAYCAGADAVELASAVNR